MGMPKDKIMVNRAPVLTLWAAVVAERLGFEREEALSLGRAVSGLTAQSKGRRLGIFTPSPKSVRRARARQRGEEFLVELCGRAIPVINTSEGVRAVTKGKAVAPASAARYLESKFGPALPEVTASLHALAESFPPEQLAARAFPLYEQFRPAIPSGVKGWGAQGELNLKHIERLARRAIPG
jgi:hypothetical protein